MSPNRVLLGFKISGKKGGGKKRKRKKTQVLSLWFAQVPPPALGKDLAQLLDMRQHADVVFRVEEEEMCAQRVILAARSPVFDALLNGEMREGKEGVVTIQDVRPPVFRALLYFAYTDELPEVRLPKILLIKSFSCDPANIYKPDKDLRPNYKLVLSLCFSSSCACIAK